MQPLDPALYARVLPLYADLGYNLSIASIVAGNTPAWAFADDPAEPRAALLWTRQDALLLAGDPADARLRVALGDVISGPILENARTRHIPAMALFYTPDAWAHHLDVLLPGLRPEQATRYYYQPGPLCVDPRASLPAAWSLEPITSDLLSRHELANIDAVAGWVSSFWRSAQAFERVALGYALRVGEEVASWCLSVYVAGRAYELGLATLPSHRNRGCATRVAAACLMEGQARGWTPHWHCWEENLPSRAVAEKLGFERPTRYMVMRFATGIECPPGRGNDTS